MTDFENTYLPDEEARPLTPSDVRDIVSDSLVNFSETGRVQKGFWQSDGFLTGTRGWQIKSNGDVEFNSGVFRGSLTAATIDIGGADATSFHVDIDGNIWSGAALFANGVFKVSNAGALTATGATVSGAITIVSGSGIANLTDAGNLATVDTADFATQVSGAQKPSNNADVTLTAVNGGLTVTGGGLTFTSGGSVKSGKTSLSDTTNAGFYLGIDGIYIGSVSDASVLKYTVGTGVFDFIGTVSSRSTAIIAGAIDSAGHFVDANLNTSAKTILTDFTFGSADYAGALKTGDITWNATTGAITGGSGILINKGGIVGAAAGVATFSIDGTTGSATFAGTLASGISMTSPVITGGTIQTATSDQRVRILSASGTTPTQTANSLGLIDSSNNLVLDFGSTSGRYFHIGTYTDQIGLSINSITGTNFSSNLIDLSLQNAGDSGHGVYIANAGTGYSIDVVSGKSNFGKTIIEGTSLPQVASTYGESLSACKAVFKASGTKISNIISQLTSDSSVAVYDAANWFGQTFQTSANVATIKSVTLYLEKIGTMGGTTHMFLFATSSGLPTGSALVDLTTAPSTFTSLNEYTFTFASPVAVSPSTTYALVFDLSSGDASNYLKFYYKNSNAYSAGSYIYSTNTGSTYAADTGKDFYFKVNELYTGSKVYKASAALNIEQSKFLGFTANSGNLDDVKPIYTGGVLDGFTSLTLNSDYYLSDTAGEISTTPGTFAIKVGTAVSTTELKIGSQPFSVFSVGDILIHSNDAGVVPTPQDVLMKAKETKLAHMGGSLRIKFSLAVGDPSYWVEGRIYRNGVAVGTLRQNTTAGEVEYSEDISGWNIGDLVQVYGTNVSGTGRAISKLRIYTNVPQVITTIS